MTDSPHAPMQRHAALAPFSRDHYVGLVQARHLRSAADQDAVTRRKAVAEFVDAWDREIAEHFADEQRLLLDLLADDDRQRLLREHEELTDLARQARALRREVDPDSATLHKIGQTLEQHIRWEERELFQRLQQQLDADTLRRLEKETCRIEEVRARSARGRRTSADIHDKDASR